MDFELIITNDSQYLKLCKEYWKIAKSNFIVRFIKRKRFNELHQAITNYDILINSR